MNYNKINNLLGWVCAAIATIVYVMTLERTVSWWDCGEFIASAFKMQIVHQPGAPLFLMVQNVFSNLAMGDGSRIAFWMNMGSAVSSGLTILFLFWTITALGRKIFVGNSREASLSSTQLFLVLSSGVVGALAYAFTDTFWFSAVESEVYAMSSLCTAVVFWGILKWEARADEPQADRWLVFIAYVMGLSIGVHLLNLLVIPAIALVIYFRKAKESTSAGILKAFVLGVVILGVILWGVIQYSIKIAAYFDLFFVNSLGTGFGYGAAVFALLVIGGITYGIYYSIKKTKPLLNIALISTAFILLGYSSFAMIMIRAKANPTLNNSDPDNAFSFLSYLNREQYGDEPLFKGRFFDSKPTGMEEGKKIYRKDGDKYVVAKRNPVYTYDKETLFPRIYSDKGGHPDYYREYLGLGPDEAPSFADNLKFFFGYQIGHMYGRYLLWNFAGRQNDQQGHGSFTEGNWVSGIKPIDNALIGGQNNLPSSAKSDPSRNTYFFLPLIIGLLGAFWHFGKKQRDAGVVGLLFFFTGIAIVLYLNQTPLQPRERDYAYAGSFYAFSIWIGLGVLAIADFLSKKTNAKVAGYTAAAIGVLAGPVILIAQNYDDHNRSEKTLARDMARNYLESCAPNAILFSYGDNDTYPLWYVQEVEGFRTDVRVVNLSLLSADWYMKQMMDKVNDADALPIQIDPELIKDGVRDVIYYQDYKIPGYVPVQDLVKVMLSDNPQNKAQLQSGEYVNLLPTKKMELAVDKQAVLANKVVPKEWDAAVVDTMRWTYSLNYVSRAELSMLAILANNNWKRPIYFTITTPEENYMGLDRYLVSEGFAYRLMPVDFGLKEGEQSAVENVDQTYDNIMNKFSWGNIGKASYVDPDSYRYISMYVGTIYGQTAQQLVAAGEIDKAKKLVINAYDNMPKRAYLMSEVMSYVPLLEVMYKVGEVAKANEITKRNLDFIRENMSYYETIAETKSNLEYRNMRFGLASIQRYKQLLDQIDQPEMKKQVDELFNTYRHYFEQAEQ
ncbi:glycosyltransferase family 117 protein [Sphingobacterium sp. LRF_L2]|uniref:glycosyltransferase family 117 protein n=1 Tax=Sphingobacterium sp. LRF_L2 TaxID=3369421 RepID=UPI003F641FB3